MKDPTPWPGPIFSVLLILRWVRIVPIAIGIPYPTILSVDYKLSLIAYRLLPTAVDSFPLRAMN